MKTVGFFVTCLVDMMRPEIGFSAIKLLEQAGFQVEVPSAQTCCGQPAYNSGDQSTTCSLAEKFIDEFERFDYIVIPSGSCGGMIKTHYADALRDSPGYRCRMEAMAPRVFELTDFLYNVAQIKQLPIASAGCFKGTMTYHDSCCGLRELGVQKQPRELLAMRVGVELKEMRDSRACCGFGGTFSIKYGDISSAIADEKCAQVHATGADALVLGDLGCMLHLEGRLRRTGDERTRVLHVAQILVGDA